MFENIQYIIYIISIMIISGLIKDYNLFSYLYTAIKDKLKSKRMVVFMVSCLGGILPIPGRVIVSAGVLDTLIDHQKPKCKYGIINFLSTHHYYWWSPLEKTVAIPMSVLGLSYLQFIKYAWVPLAISLLLMFYYIFVYLKEEDVVLKDLPETKKHNSLFILSPLLISIGVLCAGIKPYIVFPITTIVYALICREYRPKKMISYINWKLIGIVFMIMLISNYISLHNSIIISYLTNLPSTLNINTLIGFFIISILAFTASFIMGSSSKYAGIVALLCSIFGIQYLTYFLTLEFAAYILSPTHKCVLISSVYFKTPLREYYKVLVTWAVILVGYGIVSIFI